MTHSLHRQGTKENLSNDFTIFCKSARGINDEGSVPKKQRFLDIALRNNVINAAVSSRGFDSITEIRGNPSLRQEMFDSITEVRDIMVCCPSKNDVINILKETVEADLGLCILVQGVVTEVVDCLRQAGLKPHTVHHSLGVWGKTQKLPEKEVLWITTMCGHAMISTNLVKECISDITSGRTTPREAAQLLARPCQCGIFNTSRAETLLEAFSRSRKNSL